MPTSKPPIEPPPEADDPEQSRRFIEIAREVGADETPGALDKVIGPSSPTKVDIAKGHKSRTK